MILLPVGFISHLMNLGQNREASQCGPAQYQVMKNNSERAVDLVNGVVDIDVVVNVHVNGGFNSAKTWSKTQFKI